MQSHAWPGQPLKTGGRHTAGSWFDSDVTHLVVLLADGWGPHLLLLLLGLVVLLLGSDEVCVLLMGRSIAKAATETHTHPVISLVCPAALMPSELLLLKSLADKRHPSHLISLLSLPLLVGPQLCELRRRV